MPIPTSKQLLASSHRHLCKVCGYEMPCWEETKVGCDARIKSGERVCQIAKSRQRKDANAQT